MNQTDGWEAVEDYADRVRVRILLVPHPGALEDDESWDLVFHPESGFDQRGFRKELEQLGGLGGGDSCGGHGLHVLDERHSSFNWGAAAEVYDYYLMLPDEVKGALVGQALTSLCARLGKKIREHRPPGGGGIEFTLSEQSAIAAAKDAVLRRIESDDPESLTTDSVEDVGDGTFAVVLSVTTGCPRFEVTVRQDAEGTQLARVTKVSRGE